MGRAQFLSSRVVAMRETMPSLWSCEPMTVTLHLVMTADATVSSIEWSTAGNIRLPPEQWQRLHGSCEG
jgi:hypothetical protein